MMAHSAVTTGNHDDASATSSRSSSQMHPLVKIAPECAKSLSRLQHELLQQSLQSARGLLRSSKSDWQSAWACFKAQKSDWQSAQSCYQKLLKVNGNLHRLASKLPNLHRALFKAPKSDRQSARAYANASHKLWFSHRASIESLGPDPWNFTKYHVWR